MQESQSPGFPFPQEKGPGDEATGTTPLNRRYTFPKEEHLCRKKLIEELFSKQGSSFGVYPLRIVWIKKDAPTLAPPQVLISVSKRTFKRAVDRNRLKRLIREAYRLNKYRLTEQPGGHTVAFLGIIFTGKEKSQLTLVEKKLISAIHRLLAVPGEASASPPAA
ncbi:ribonuclease P protein component [Hymenobacter siberiensis]|jgi:ribonuclease P protein component|uniref:ribonuclease P protein component n=1 Tax=Hymenobacter siberiensis TaxID=2848396 RepID=UPI001C1E19E4|nr:ribonuclease P protein component [Hymenobacter siberiensis]MBU6119250.1 ribonuclease P protein component [Hymenobacter siberiensis]